MHAPQMNGGVYRRVEVAGPLVGPGMPTREHNWRARGCASAQHCENAHKSSCRASTSLGARFRTREGGWRGAVGLPGEGDPGGVAAPDHGACWERRRRLGVACRGPSECGAVVVSWWVVKDGAGVQGEPGRGHRKDSTPAG